MDQIQAAFERGDYNSLMGLGLMNWATSGNVQAQELAGNCYQFGFGVPIDLAQAAHWYEQAIANGSGLAANNLAGIVSQGYEEHLPNQARAQELFDLARSLSFEHAPKAAA
jgi:TPR repeat protein